MLNVTETLLLYPTGTVGLFPSCSYVALFQDESKGYKNYVRVTWAAFN